MRKLEAALGLKGTRQSFIDQYATLYMEPAHAHGAYGGDDYMRRTGNEPDVLQRRGD